MKFSCDRHSIAEAFQLVAAVAPQRSLKPILTRAKLTVRKDAIEIEATDFEVAVRTSVKPSSVEREGALAVPAEKVASILRDATDEKIEAEVEAEVLTLVCRDGFYRVLGEPVDDFPPIPRFEKTNAKLKGRLLADMMRKTSFAAAEERSRYSLNGVYILLGKNTMTLAATDGRRLAVREEKLGSGVESASGIVPTKGIATIRRVVESVEDVELCLTENMIMVRGGGTEVFSRLVEGKFPDYGKVIPSGNDKKVVAEREELLGLVRRASLLAPVDSRSVNFCFERGAVKICARTAEVGEAELSLPVSYDGPALEIRFNPDYVADVLRILEADQVSLEIKDADCAGMIRDGKGYTYVIMPLST